MNKILIPLVLFSVSLNLYQYFTPIRSTSLPVNAIHESQDSNIPNRDNINKLKTSTSSAKEPTSQNEDNEAVDKFLYEKVSEKTTNDIETFLIRDLNFNVSEASEVFNIIKKSEKEFAAMITKKQNQLKGQNNESFGYTYDPEDYILLGTKRLEARALIKDLIGNDKYKKLLIYIRDYNNGKYSDSVVPIDF